MKSPSDGDFGGVGTEQPPVWTYDDLATIRARNLTLFQQGVQAAAPYIAQGDTAGAVQAMNAAIPAPPGAFEALNKSVASGLAAQWAQPSQQDQAPTNLVVGNAQSPDSMPTPAPAPPAAFEALNKNVASGLAAKWSQSAAPVPDQSTAPANLVVGNAAPPQPVTPYQLPTGNDLTVGSNLQQSPPQPTGEGIGPITPEQFAADAAAAKNATSDGFLSDLKAGVAKALSGAATAAGDVHSAYTAANNAVTANPDDPNDPRNGDVLQSTQAALGQVATAGQAVFAPLSGETSAARHPILDAQGNPTGQFYRDKPGFADMASSLLGLITNPVQQLSEGPQAFNERLANPAQTAVTRGILQAGSNPLTYAFGPEAGATNAALTVGGNVLNEHASQIPGYRDLSPEQQQALQMIVPIVGGVLGKQVLDSAGAQKILDTLGVSAAKAADALTTGALSGERGSIELGPQGEDLPTAGAPSAKAALLRARVTALGGQLATPSGPELLNIPGDELAGFVRPAEGLSIGQRLSNQLHSFANKPEHFNPVVTPIMEDMRQNAATLKSQAIAMAEEAKQTYGMFAHDSNGRVILQDGTKAFLPDLAQTFSTDPESLADKLTPIQANALARDMSNHAAFRNTAGAAGIDIGEVDGYLPRGTPEQPGEVKRLAPPSNGSAGGRVGSEKSRVYDTMEEGVANGEKYPSYPEAVANTTSDLANRIAAAHASELLKPLGTTAGDRLDPVLREQVTGLRNNLASLNARLGTAEDRAGIAAGKGAELNAPLAKLSDIAPAGEAKAQLAASVKTLNMARQAALRAARDAGGSAVIDAQTQAAFNATLTKVSDDLASRSIMPADQIQRLLLKNLEGTPVASASKQAANAYLLHGAAEIAARNATGDLFDATKAALSDARDLAPADVYTTIRQMQRRADVLSARGTKWSGLADSIRQELSAAQAKYDQILPTWQDAKVAAAATPRGYSGINLAPLSGHAFPNDVANAANAALETPENLAGKIITKAGNALNTTRTLLDFATPMRLMAADVMHPQAAVDSLGTAIKSVFGHPGALGEVIANQNAAALADSTHTSVPTMVRDYGLKLSASQPEGGLLTSFPRNLPVLKQGSRFINTYLDGFRIRALDDSIGVYKQAGLIDTPASRKALGNVINIATGAGRPLFGANGYGLVNFPKWLGSQLEFITKAAADGSLQGAYARESLIKLLGGATALTYAVNMAQGKPTKWTDGVPTMWVGDTAINPFGTWGTLIRATGKISPVALDREHNLQRPDFAYIVKSKGAPPLQIAADLITGYSFNGITPSVTNPNYLLRQMAPYTVSNVGEESLPTWALNSIGARARNMTATENLDVFAKEQGYSTFFGAPPSVQAAIKGAHPDAWATWVAQASPNTRQYDTAKAQFLTDQGARDSDLLSGKLTVPQWYNTLISQQQQLIGQAAAIYGSGNHAAPKNASDRYYAEINADTVHGVPDWAKVDAWRAAQPQADQDYIAANTALNQTPLTALRRSLQKQYDALPEYAGLTPEQSNAVNKLYTVVQSSATTKSQLGYLQSLSHLPDYAQLDPNVVKLVRRKLANQLVTLPQRGQWVKAHPESVLLYGKGSPSPAAIAAINKALAAAAGTTTK